MRIVTDSAADLTARDIEQYGLAVAPLYINSGNTAVRSEDLSPDQFYRQLAERYPEIPTTSQPSVGDFVALYETIAAEDPDILSVHISSGLSGTYETACEAARRLAKATVSTFDTLTLSGGERFHVLAAALAAAAGMARDAIVALLEKVREQTEVVFTLETLEYLIRGGRIGRVQGVVASLLSMKPVIHVNREDGKYDAVAKPRTFTKALSEIASYLAEVYEGRGPLWVCVMHGDNEPAATTLATLLRERLSMGRFELLRVSPVLGVHTGPSVVGACACPLSALEGLVVAE